MTEQPRHAAPEPTGFPSPQVDVADPLADLIRRYFRPGLVDGVIRTWVPVAVGSAMSWASSHFGLWDHIGLPDQPSTGLIIFVTAVMTAAWYAAARAVELRWPRLGRWLVALNLTRARPAYTTSSAVVRRVSRN